MQNGYAVELCRLSSSPIGYIISENVINMQSNCLYKQLYTMYWPLRCLRFLAKQLCFQILYKYIGICCQQNENKARGFGHKHGNLKVEKTFTII
jgi:hypothetical protein